jgi:hypothetical protein
VEDLYIDWQEREVRFLELGAGGFLGIGEKRFLVPVEAVTQVAEDRVTIERAGQDRESGRSRPLRHQSRAPRADEPRDEDLRLVPIKTIIDLLQRGQAT